MSDESTVLVRTEGRIGRITLNRPKAINALTHEMVLDIDAALRRWADDDAVEAVVLDGAGERGLCAGGDIVAIHRDALQSVTLEDAVSSPSGKFWYDEYILNAYISHYPKPYIAMMDGIVMGGGVGISAHGNTRIVTDRTKMAMPEVGIGFAPDVGGTYLLANASGELGTYLALTGAQINGADAIAVGFADHYLPSEKIAAFISALTTRPVAEVLGEFCIEPPKSGLPAKKRWIDDAFAADTAVEIVERLRGHDESDAHDAANVVAAKSPTSVEVTVRSLREITAAETERSGARPGQSETERSGARPGEPTTLETALVTEYRVSIHFLTHHDLAEGIRAQVIDKDRSPKWSPPSLTTVNKADIDTFFAPIPKELELPNGVH